MEAQLRLIQRRSIIFLRLIWVFLVADVILNLCIHAETDISNWAVGISLFLAVIATFLVWRKIWVRTVMYLMVVLLYLALFVLIIAVPNPVNYLFMWLGIVLCSLYQEYLIIILAAVLSAGITVYTFLNYQLQVFPGTTTIDLLFYLLFTGFICSTLLALTRLTRKLWLRAERSQEQLQSILDNVEIATWSYQVNSRHLQLSSGIEKIIGISYKHFLADQQIWQDIVHPDDILRVKEVQKHMVQGKLPAVEFRINRPDGETVWLLTRGTPVRDYSGQVIRLDGVLINITERKYMEEKIIHMAYHDTLTGLPNQALLSDWFDGIASRVKNQEQNLAVLFVDLDYFKEVNDTLGHAMGDLLLQQIASRLKTNLRDTDILCRRGGDEFIIMLPGVTKKEAANIAQRTLNSLAQPFLLAGQEARITGSIGISISPQDGLDMDILVKHADTALYQAKENGRNKYQFYQAS